MSLIQPLTLQRLVDGELDTAGMQSLLRDADGQPEMWKEIATAFVEDRVWQNSFVDSSDMANANPMFGSSNPKPAERATHKKRNGYSDNRWRRLFSMAAAVLLATGIGFMIGNQQPASQSPSNGIADASRDEGSLSSDQITRVSVEPDYRMQLDDDFNNEIPLYDASRAKELGLSLEPASIPDSLQKFATESGYQLDENLRYISGRMDNGNRFVVPVRRIQFIPGQ